MRPLAYSDPGVERERATDLRRSAGFVDVAVQRDEGLILLEDLAHSGRADRHLVGLAVAHDDAQLLIDLIGGVEARCVGRHVQVEDRGLRALQLLGQVPDARVQRVLVQLARAVPRRRVGV